MNKLIAALLLSAFLAVGCASATVLKSSPSGAKVYVDQKLLGNTPVKYEDSDVFWAKRDVEVQMDGYEPYKTKLAKTEPRVSAIIGALLVGVPILWVTEYPDEINYELRALPQAMGQAPAAQAPAVPESQSPGSNP